MLFNSYEFVLLFLPVVVAGFFLLSGFGRVRLAAAWLALASIAFYGYWDVRFVGLLLGSICWNYALALRILKSHSAAPPNRAKFLLFVAVASNLLVLGYFKYFNFFTDTLAGLHVRLPEMSRVVLPIGISFFTFTQIAFLVDTYQGKVRESNFVHYALFVTYFPHLIAGPVLHHAEMMPQFARRETYRLVIGNFALGFTTFAIGLIKKVVLADGIQPFVGPVFDADPGVLFSGLEAWGAALAYTMQLYFDFSGYSDMAIGLSKMLNIDLPLNFNSPYKALDITDFWRRWHMTLSRFLRDYLYIPLGGNRHGEFRRYLNLSVTMLLGGLWHGAGWPFVIWGGLHGIYLMINHAWQAAVSRLPDGIRRLWASRAGRLAAWTLTFGAVVFAWVFFRATTLGRAAEIVADMTGSSGWWPASFRGSSGARLLFAETTAYGGARQLVWTAVLMVLAICAPNTQTLMAPFSRWLVRRRGDELARCGLVIGGLLVLTLLLLMINASRGVSEFIYFNF